VSDYSRYLPEDTNGRHLFWAIYAGNVLATIFACGIGAFLGALLPELTLAGAVHHVNGAWALIVLALSLVVANTFNAYTGSFQVLALGNMFRRLKAESVMLRVVPFLVVMAAGVIIAFLGYNHFVYSLQNFLGYLLVIFIPWSAVNLVDYFIVRHGNYDVSAFFVPNGRYGKFAWRGLAAYFVGLAAEAPFIAQPDYTGPLVKILDGADISWIVGWIVAAGAYLILVRIGGNQPAPAAPGTAAASG
jgi:NCS1 family nucleobase:cation symporter-1